MREKLVVIIGPTAVGKTRLSVDLAKELNGEVISGDSMQVYKEMDIGTAKVTTEEMQGVPHHMIDIKEPTESFSAAEFQDRVKKLITEINERGKVPILAGGTGLYVQSVIYDYHFSEAVSNEAYREGLEKMAQREGNDVLYEELKAVDPISAQNIHPNNVRRVIRALEVYHETGKTMAEYQQHQPEKTPYQLALIGLMMERDILYDRINLRVDKMVEAGLIKEVMRLHNKGIKDCQSVQAIGYKEVYQFLDGELTKEEAIELLKRNSRRYAKRQFTWFRNKMDVEWFDMTNADYNEKKQEIFEYVAGKLEESAK